MENQTTTTKVALKWGVITGILGVVLSTLIMVLGLTENKFIGSLAYVIIAVGICLAMVAFKKDSNGFMSYGQGLGIGLLTAAVSSLITSAYSFIYMKFIDPTVIEKMLKKVEADLEKQGMPSEQIDKVLEISKLWMSPGPMFVTGVIISIIIGLIISLIASAIFKKDKPIFD